MGLAWPLRERQKDSSQLATSAETPLQCGHELCQTRIKLHMAWTFLVSASEEHCGF